MVITAPEAAQSLDPCWGTDPWAVRRASHRSYSTGSAPVTAPASLCCYLPALQGSSLIQTQLGRGHPESGEGTTAEGTIASTLRQKREHPHTSQPEDVGGPAWRAPGWTQEAWVRVQLWHLPAGWGTSWAWAPGSSPGKLCRAGLMGEATGIKEEGSSRDSGNHPEQGQELDHLWSHPQPPTAFQDLRKSRWERLALHTGIRTSPPAAYGDLESVCSPGPHCLSTAWHCLPLVPQGVDNRIPQSFWKSISAFTREAQGLDKRKGRERKHRAQDWVLTCHGASGKPLPLSGPRSPCVYNEESKSDKGSPPKCQERDLECGPRQTLPGGHVDLGLPGLWVL